MFRIGTSTPTGAIALQPLRGNPYAGYRAHHPVNIWRHALPCRDLPLEVNLWRVRNLPNLWRGLWRIWIAELLGITTIYGSLFLRKQDGRTGRWLEFGLVSLRVITTAGATDICSRMGNSTPANIANFKFHGFGTGTTAESSSDTGLVTELTTQYATDNTRVTGTQTPSSNTYATQATLTPDSGGVLAITEHGVFNASSAGTLLDRSKFSAVNLDSAAGDSLQATYTFTEVAGS